MLYWKPNKTGHWISEKKWYKYVKSIDKQKKAVYIKRNNCIVQSKNREIMKSKIPVYKELQQAYEFYNNELFDNYLPECIITLEKTMKYIGYFEADSYRENKENGEGGKKHEIRMSSEYFAVRPIEMTLSTVVHEMCHMYCHILKIGGRRGYHNKDWAETMERVGLIPSDTGLKDGKKTGDKMSHYIAENGLFEIKTKKIIKNGFILPLVAVLMNDVVCYTYDEAKEKAVPGKQNVFLDEENNEVKGKPVLCGTDNGGKDIVKILIEKKSAKTRSLYICKCKNKVYGKTGLSMKCNDCVSDYIEINIKEDTDEDTEKD